MIASGRNTDHRRPIPAVAPRHPVGRLRGLLILMAVLAFKADSALRDIEARNARIRQEFLMRDDLLDQLRSNLYKSGIDVRDYLLETDEAARRNSDRSCGPRAGRCSSRSTSTATTFPPKSRARSRSSERASRTIGGCCIPWWAGISALRLGAGDTFLREQVFPRHEQLLALSDQIAAVNDRQLRRATSRWRPCLRRSGARSPRRPCSAFWPVWA